MKCDTCNAMAAVVVKTRMVPLTTSGFCWMQDRGIGVASVRTQGWCIDCLDRLAVVGAGLLAPTARTN